MDSRCGAASRYGGSYAPGQARGTSPSSNRSREAQAPTSTATVRTRTEKDSSSLKLTLRTNEGDTVEISLDAQNTRTIERGRVQTQGASASLNSDTRPSTFNASVKVNGDLSDKEMADIQSLLSALASGKAPEDTASNSIGTYNFSLQQSREVTRAKVQIFA